MSFNQDTSMNWFVHFHLYLMHSGLSKNVGKEGDRVTLGIMNQKMPMIKLIFVFQGGNNLMLAQTKASTVIKLSCIE